MLCVILFCLFVICFRMHALFLLLVDHVSKTKKWKYFTLLFGLVLTPP